MPAGSCDFLKSRFFKQIFKRYDTSLAPRQAVLLVLYKENMHQAYVDPGPTLLTPFWIKNTPCFSKKDQIYPDPVSPCYPFPR